MAGLLAQADLAIGAGGLQPGNGAPWACRLWRCAPPTTSGRCSPMPAAADSYSYLDDPSFTAASLAVHLRAILGSGGLRNLLSRTGLELVDAMACAEVVRALSSYDVSVRVARPDDCDTVHGWRNDVRIRSVSEDQRVISAEEHRRWFHQLLQSPGSLSVDRGAGRRPGGRGAF